MLSNLKREYSAIDYAEMIEEVSIWVMGVGSLAFVGYLLYSLFV